MEKKVIRIIEELKSRDIKVVRSALKRAEKLAYSGYYSDELTEALTSLFFKDVYEYPDWRENVENAADIIGKFGKRSISSLLSLMEKSDAKAAFYFALSIGNIGIASLDPVIQKLLRAQSDYLQALLIFSLGKIKDREIRRAIPDILPYLNHSDSEVKDSAARTLGKIFENITPSDISEQETLLVFEKLLHLLEDSSSKVRAKALHSIGKQLHGGFLPNDVITHLEKEVKRILGRDNIHDWDDAYIVRREAQELLPLIDNYIKK